MTKAVEDLDGESVSDRWHLVQRAVFGLDGKPDKLYFRWQPVVADDLLAHSPPKAHRFSLDAERGVLLNFCTLSNAFYEAYWRQYTRVQDIAFRITIENGKGWIKLVRMMPSKEHVQISLQFFDAKDAPATLTLIADRVEPRSSGILFVELMATEGRVRLSRAAWFASCDRPLILPRLHIGICTYNRAPFVKRLLQALNADEFVSGLVEGVLCVSQGEDTHGIVDGIPDLTPDFARKVRVVQQDNMGGSGGFGRAMYEMSKTDDGVCALMDDDIEVEPESLFRAVSFHTLLRKPACVGGQMLELHRPSNIWETGSQVDFGRFAVSNPLGEIDASRIKGIRRFVQPTECSYNAWWFFLFSTSLIREHGFPLPLFLWWDDVEYGLRLLHNDIPTISLPGVFVWHESFRVKAAGPRPYYDLRNSFIIAAIHDQGFSTMRAVGELFVKWSERILLHDYGGAHLVLKAVAGFLKGPCALQSANPGALHREVIGEGRRHSTSVTASRRTVIGYKVRIKRSQRNRGVFKGPRVRRILHALLAPIERKPAAIPIIELDLWHWHVISKRSYYAVDLGDPVTVLSFTRSRRSVARAMSSLAWATLQLMIFGRRAQREWKSASPELTSRPFWERYLCRSGDREVSKSSFCGASGPMSGSRNP